MERKQSGIAVCTAAKGQRARSKGLPREPPNLTIDESTALLRAGPVERETLHGTAGLSDRRIKAMPSMKSTWTQRNATHRRDRAPSRVQAVK